MRFKLISSSSNQVKYKLCLPPDQPMSYPHVSQRCSLQSNNRQTSKKTIWSSLGEGPMKVTRRAKLSGLSQLSNNSCTPFPRSHPYFSPLFASTHLLQLPSSSSPFSSFLLRRPLWKIHQCRPRLPLPVSRLLLLMIRTQQ